MGCGFLSFLTYMDHLVWFDVFTYLINFKDFNFELVWFVKIIKMFKIIQIKKIFLGNIYYYFESGLI